MIYHDSCRHAANTNPTASSRTCNLRIRTGQRHFRAGAVGKIDEAHLLDNTQMEAIRMLTNHDMDSGSPFAALLVGQPTLRHRLRLGVLAALDQRIAMRYAIAGMAPADTADYIAHHAKIAGRTDTLFSDDAITLIHNAARGYPRAVNNLAVHALTAAFAAKAAIVDEIAARIAVTETGHD